MSRVRWKILLNDKVVVSGVNTKSLEAYWKAITSSLEILNVEGYIIVAVEE